MNGRELESGGHHYPKDFRRELTPECSVTYSPSLESHPLVAARRHATVKSKVYVTPHGAPHRTRAASELGL
jgi:hypothetical protein